MKFECATIEEAETKVQELKGENKYVISALANTDGFVVEWQEHKKYTAQDGKEFYDEIWVTKEGKLIQVQDLESEHCRNVLRMLLRQEREARAAMAGLGEKLEAMLQGAGLGEADDEYAPTPTAEPSRVLH